MIRVAIRVVFIDDANDRRDVHEIVGIDRGQRCPAVRGLSLAERRKITGGIQQALTGFQVAEWQADQRACPELRQPALAEWPPSIPSCSGHHSASCGSTANGSGFVFGRSPGRQQSNPIAVINGIEARTRDKPPSCRILPGRLQAPDGTGTALQGRSVSVRDVCIGVLGDPAGDHLPCEGEQGCSDEHPDDPTRCHPA